MGKQLSIIEDIRCAPWFGAKTRRSADGLIIVDEGDKRPRCASMWDRKVFLTCLVNAAENALACFTSAVIRRCTSGACSTNGEHA
jgi:hypothetical protein